MASKKRAFLNFFKGIPAFIDYGGQNWYNRYNRKYVMCGIAGRERMFVGRQYELEQLDEAYHGGGFVFAAIYGRR